MNKLIIDNRTDLSDLKALDLVSRVVEGGRVSNEGKQYCYGTQITVGDKDYLIWTHLNKKSDRFIIINKKYGNSKH